MKNPDLTGRAKIGFEEYDLCKYCILDIKRFINQGRAEQTEPQTEMPEYANWKDSYDEMMKGVSNAK